ncbi:hypothetical protein [Piscinibacter sp.]|uniref:hypothetical protein n=1 Tax=Piscinibacter sp. TaxID=1903157 RepID=UPI002F401921
MFTESITGLRKKASTGGGAANAAGLAVNDSTPPTHATSPRRILRPGSKLHVITLLPLGVRTPVMVVEAVSALSDSAPRTWLMDARRARP